MRKIDLLIDQARRATDNIEHSDTAGISDEEFLQYANDSLDQLQAAISVHAPDVFQIEKIIQAVPGQETYDIPDDAFLGQRVDMVEFSHDGSESGYYIVKKGNKRERIPGLSSAPAFYIRRSGKLLFEPAPQSAGLFRVLYQKTTPRLDVRRGTVLSVTLGANSITSLTLDPSLQIDDVELLQEGYCTIVNAFGDIQMRRIPVTAIDTNLGIVTVDPSFTFEDGETISAGDYICRGRESTTHCQMDDITEGYIIAYMKNEILKRDSSNDSKESQKDVDDALNLIVASFNEPDGDVNLVPIISAQYLTED